MALSSVTAFALEPSEMLLIQKGPTALKPQLEVSQTYSDNITYREEDRESDFITTVSPGLSFQAGSQTFNFIDFTYFFDRVQYWDNDSLSANQHRANLTLRFEKSRFLLEGVDEFKNLSSPLGGGISVRGAEIERFVWIDIYKLTYDFSDKTAVYLEALHSSTDFDADSLRASDPDIRLYDAYTLIGTLGFEYKAFSRTSFFGEAYYGLTDTDGNGLSPGSVPMAEYPTANFVGGFVGARGAFTEQLFGMVKGGYEYRWYSGDDQSSAAPVVSVSLTERFTERSTLSIGYTRSQRESAQFVGSTYVNDSVSLNYMQHLAADGRLRANLMGSYSLADYVDDETSDDPSDNLANGRLDQLVNAGLTFTYDIKLWLRAYASYDFEYLDSTLDSIQDYYANRVTVGMQLGY
jgi:hypothetical protein